MTPSTKLQQAMNDQIRKELESAYIYLSMAAWMEDQSLSGFATWLRHQAREEAKHAMRIFEHLVDRNARVRLQAIAGPAVDFESALSVFDQVKHHEESVTKSIHELYRIALDEKDYASEVFLAWFVKEQVEEERQANQVYDSLRIAGDNKAALLILDREMSHRGPDDDGDGDGAGGDGD